MKVYGKQQGFEIIRKRLELHEDGNIKHRSFRCEFGGHYQPKKQVNIHNHHNCKSKRQGCEWHANVNCPKNICQITLTTLNDTHNHPLHLNTENTLQYIEQFLKTFSTKSNFSRSMGAYQSAPRENY